MDQPGVLKEIDCFISKSLRNQLLLLLYKNREYHRTLESERIRGAKIKSSLDLIEFNVHDGRSQTVDFSGDRSDSYTLRSTIVKQPRSLVGYFVNDEVHFSPLDRDALVIDTNKEPIKESKKIVTEGGATTSDSTPSTSSATVISAKMKNESNIFRNSMAARRKPADSDPDAIFLIQQAQAPWKSVRYRKFSSDEAFEDRIPLLYPYEESQLLMNHMTGPRQDEYTASLLLPLKPETVNPNYNRIEPPKTQTLEEIIQSIMLQAHVIRFSKLIVCARERHKYPHQVTPPAVLQHLPKVATLVRGWWVVKSELLYPPTTQSEHSAVPNTLLIRARDYILAVFHRGEHLTRKTISSMTKLPTLEATEMLKPIAQKMSKPLKGHANHWEFHPIDQEFTRRHPDIVQQQKAAWELRIRQLCTQLKLEHLVSDGIRRKWRASGRFSSESGSESEKEFLSLVSGVHVSSAKRINCFGRKRQLSLSHDSSSPSNNSLQSPHHPTRKRIRTQSLSTVYTSSSPLPPPPSLPVPALSTNPPSCIRNDSNSVQKSQFVLPTSPPPSKTVNFVKSNSSGEISKNLTHDQDSIATAVFCKQEPPSPPPPTDPPVNNESPTKVKCSPTSFMQHLDDTDQTEVMFPTQPIDGSLTDSSSLVPLTSPKHLPDLSRNMIGFVRDIITTRPIVPLSDLAKMYQQHLGILCMNNESLYENMVDVPPPGSELEREYLKTQLLEALKVIDARQLTICWPQTPDRLPEEPIFVPRVAGLECGAINESVQKLRDIILELFENQPSFRMKELTDKIGRFPPCGMSEKTFRAFIKHYCIIRKGRYFLRFTISGDN